MEEPLQKKHKSDASSESPEANKEYGNGSGSGNSNGTMAAGFDSLYIPKFSLPKHDDASINAVKISEDKTKLATCCSKGVIRIYDLETGSQVATLKGHTKGISDIAFSPSNSDIIASGSDDLTIRLWSISRHKCLRILKKHTYHITALVFNSKGSILISGSADETIVVWDLTSGRSLRTLAAHSDPISSLCLTPDDSLIVSSSYDGLMRLFDVETGQCLKTLIYNSTSHGTATASTNDVVNFPISHVTISPNGKYILSSSLDGKIRLWDYMNNKVVKTYSGLNGTTPINQKYNSDSVFMVNLKKPVVVSGSDSSGVLFWDLQSKSLVSQLEPGQTILGLSICRNGLYLASSSLQGNVTVYELNKDYAKATASPKSDRSMSLSPQSQTHDEQFSDNSSIVTS